VAYQANKPQATDQLSVSQGDIQGNFAAIKTLIDVNHVDFASANQGKHYFVEFPKQTAPLPVASANEVALYCQQSSYTSQPELVFSHQLGSNAPVPARIVEFTSAYWGTNGWTRLPSGILLKWGQALLSNGLTTTTITYPAGGAYARFASTPYSIIVSPITYSGTAFDHVINVVNSATTIDSFRVNCASAFTDNLYVSYLAIGI